MKLPNVSVRRETHVGSSSATPVEAVGSWAMVDWDVCTDPRLKHLDVRVYAILAACRRGTQAKMGTRLIAKDACTSQRRVIVSLRALEERGYIKREMGSERSRAAYLLTYWRFAIKTTETKVDTDVDKTETRPRKELVQCPKCAKRVGGLKRVGWCRACDRDLNTRKLVREEIAKLA